MSTITINELFPFVLDIFFLRFTPQNEILAWTIPRYNTIIFYATLSIQNNTFKEYYKFNKS